MFLEVLTIFLDHIRSFEAGVAVDYVKLLGGQVRLKIVYGIAKFLLSPTFVIGAAEDSEPLIK